MPLSITASGMMRASGRSKCRYYDHGGYVMWLGKGCSAPEEMPRGRFNGPLDLRAPEDQFSSDDQIEKRHRSALVAPELDGTIAAFMHAWAQGDEDGARLAAKELVDGTHAHFQAEGVPVFAHPIVPPQFAQAIAGTVRSLPAQFREGALQSALGAFEDSVRQSVEREVALAFKAGSRTSEIGQRKHPAREAQPTDCGCSACAAKPSASYDRGW